MYENLTPELLLAGMIGRLETDLQTREGSFTRDVLSAAAVELWKFYSALDAQIPQFYIDETSGPFIDRQCAMFGLSRLAGIAAIGSIQFAGTAGTVVAAGTAFYTEDGLRFTLREAVTLGEGGGSGTLVAEAAGARYNVAAGAITRMWQNVPGLTTFASAPMSGGTDAESDAALAARFYHYLQRPATSGNAYDYQNWAEAVTGVGAARVIAKWDGNGTVKVLCVDGEMAPCGASVLSAVRDAVELQRPCGAAVTVSAPSAVGITVSAAVTVSASTTKAAVQSAWVSNLDTYLRGLIAGVYADNLDGTVDDLSEATYAVLYSRVTAALLAVPGVTDATSITLNGGSGNVVLAADAAPLLGEVVVT